MDDNKDYSVFVEEALKLVQTHSIGEISGSNSAFESSWNATFSNLAKLGAQYAFEYDLKHFANSGYIEKIKTGFPEFYQLQTLAN